MHDVGIWQSTMAVNGYTMELHHEDDCTYTVIHVPQQADPILMKSYAFQSALGKKCNISFPFHDHTTILFCGTYLTHCQTCEDISTNNDKCFINFGAYGNRRLLSHIRKSFQRNEA